MVPKLSKPRAMVLATSHALDFAPQAGPPFGDAEGYYQIFNDDVGHFQSPLQGLCIDLRGGRRYHRIAERTAKAQSASWIASKRHAEKHLRA